MGKNQGQGTTQIAHQKRYGRNEQQPRDYPGGIIGVKFHTKKGIPYAGIPFLVLSLSENHSLPYKKGLIAGKIKGLGPMA